MKYNVPPLRTSLPLLLSVVACWILTSCAMKPPAKLPGFQMDVDQPDVPVPTGFQRRPDSSWSYVEFSAETPGGFRSWKSEYVGLRKPRHVAAWYLEKMPEHGWTHKSSFAGSKPILTFTKGISDIAVVKIERRFNPPEDRYETIIVAEIKPQGPEGLALEEILSPGRTGAPLPAPVPSSGTEAAVEPTITPVGTEPPGSGY